LSGVFAKLATSHLDVVDRYEVCYDGKFNTDWLGAYITPVFSLFPFPSAPAGLILGAISIPCEIYEKNRNFF